MVRSSNLCDRSASPAVVGQRLVGREPTTHSRTEAGRTHTELPLAYACVTRFQVKAAVTSPATRERLDLSLHARPAFNCGRRRATTRRPDERSPSAERP